MTRQVLRLLSLLVATVAVLLVSGARAELRSVAQAPGTVIVEPDDGRQPVLDFIAAAQRSVDLAIYELTDSRVIGALGNAAARGVRVRVLYEPLPGGHPVNAKSIAELQQKGVLTRESSPSFRLTHEKALVADATNALIMSLNLVAVTFTETRDVGVVDSDPGDVGEIESVFQADWDRTAVAVSQASLVWSPDNSRSRLLALIASAQVSLDIYAEELTDKQIVDALGTAVATGVQLRLLMTDMGAHDPARTRRALLLSEGGEIRLIAKPYVHAKVVLVDGARAYAGSENFTAASLNENRELGVLTSDPWLIRRFSDAFNQDWQQAVPAIRS